MKNFISAPARSIAVLFGILGGAVCWLAAAILNAEDPLAWGLIVGAILTFCTVMALAIINVVLDKRYRGIENTIGKVYLAINAHVTVEDTSRNGYMYLTEDSLKGFFRDRKPYTTVTFLKEAGYEVKIISPVSLEISDKMHTFEIVSTDIALLSAAMHRKGWNIIEEDEE